MNVGNLRASVADAVASMMQAERDLIDADLIALGVTEATAHEYEVVHQHAPDGGMAVYRGIRHRGTWVWDRHPDWPIDD